MTFLGVLLNNAYVINKEEYDLSEVHSKVKSYLCACSQIVNSYKNNCDVFKEIFIVGNFYSQVNSFIGQWA